MRMVKGLQRAIVSDFFKIEKYASFEAQKKASEITMIPEAQRQRLKG